MLQFIYHMYYSHQPCIIVIIILIPLHLQSYTSLFVYYWYYVNFSLFGGLEQPIRLAVFQEQVLYVIDMLKIQRLE